MSKRLFIAVDIPVSDDMIEFSQMLKKKLINERVRWVRLTNFHLTLKFLGDTEDSIIPDIIKRLQQTVSGIKPFEINIKGMGKFSSSGHTKVIWLGVEDLNKVLNNIAEQLNTSLVDLGFKFERTPYKPHLTLGRVKYIHNENILLDLINKYSNTPFQNHKVKELILYQSILKPSGPIYKRLINVSL